MSSFEPEQCQGADCEEMRKGALQLVQQMLSNDLSEESRLKSLTHKQCESYKAAAAIAGQTSDPDASEEFGFVPYVLRAKYTSRILPIFPTAT
jgi:hypothetical protein